MKDWTVWGFVGRAHYFLGNWKEACDALRKTIEFKGDEGPTLAAGPRWWYLTMSLHQLGEVEVARSYYDQLVKEVQQSPPDYDCTMYAAEAAELMGIERPLKEKAKERSAQTPESSNLPVE